MRIFIEARSLLQEIEPVVLDEFKDFGSDLITQLHDGPWAWFPLLSAGAFLLPQVGDFGVGQRRYHIPENLLSGGFRRQNASDLFAHDTEYFGEVLDSSAHFLPRLVYYNDTIAEQLLEWMVVVKEHRVERRALLTRSISNLKKNNNIENLKKIHFHSVIGSIYDICDDILKKPK